METKLNGVFALLCVILFSSCDAVLFEQPQPKGASDLSEVPAKLRGNYYSVSLPKEPSRDTLLLEITDTRFRIHEISWKKTVWRASDSTAQDHTSATDWNESVSYRYSRHSDTLITRKEKINTFTLGKGVVLRAFKDSWCVSIADTQKTNTPEVRWMVYLLTQKKDSLQVFFPMITELQNKPDAFADSAETAKLKREKQERLQLYSGITPMKAEPSMELYYTCDPTEAAFGELYAKGLFKPVTSFKKMQ